MRSSVAFHSVARRVIEKMKSASLMMRLALYVERRWPGPWGKILKAVAPKSEFSLIPRGVSISYEDLNPKAQHIYYELKAAIEKRRK